MHAIPWTEMGRWAFALLATGFVMWVCGLDMLFRGTGVKTRDNNRLPVTVEDRRLARLLGEYQR